MTGANSGASLTSRVVKGTAWLVAARFSMRAIGFLNTILVARLLLPEDFGLVAIGIAAMQLIQGFSNIGLAQAVIKFHDASEDDYNTLFTVSFARGVLIGVLLLALGPLVAQIYGDQRLILLFAAIAIYPVLLGMMNPRFYEFERALDYSREFIATVADKMVAVSVSITIALIFRSYWALVAGLLAGGLTMMLVSYIVKPVLPSLTLKSWRRVLGFSGWLTGLSFLVALNNKLDMFVLARYIGVGATGIYSLGTQFAGQITSELAEPLARAIYPGLSELRERAEDMRRAFLGGVSAVAAIALPAAFGMSFVAHDLVAIVLGEKWRAAVPVLQWMAPALGAQAMMLSMHYYAIARDKIPLLCVRELVVVCVKLPVFIWASANYGLTGAIYAASSAGMFHMTMQLFLYAKVANDAFWRPIAVAWRSIAGVMGMAVWFLGVRQSLIPLDQVPIFFRLVLDIAVGGTLYVATHLLVWIAVGRPDGVERRVLKMVDGFVPISLVK